MLAGALTVLTGVLPTGCASLERTDHLVYAGAAPVNALPGWQQESAAGLRQALYAQCEAARLQSPWPGLCSTLSRLPSQAAQVSPDSHRNPTAETVRPDTHLKHWVRKHFEAWQFTNRRGAASGVLTGYYEPLLTGSLWRENDAQVALYSKPDSLRTAEPGMTRRQIETGASRGRLAGRQLVWLDDPVEAFFLHIQGSGRIRLRDGRIVRASFAAHNGHPYFAIGRELIRTGEISRRAMTADRIKQWLRDNPDRAAELMWRNPRYVFFKLLTGLPDSIGPAGSLQVPLTSLRSVATDKRFVPAGALLYLDTPLPVSKSERVGLTLTQDTGGAIRGAVRADLFTGTGHSAGQLAGRLNQPMRMWLLWPKGKVPPARIPVARLSINP